MELIFPEWLDSRIVDAGPGAYGGLEPELRARLKSQIAFLHSYYGESRADASRRAPWLDRDIFDEEGPVSWAVYLVAPGYSSGPGLLAAVMPALLAGVREIAICRVAARESASPEDGCEHFGPLPLSISAALELAGLEQVYDLDAADALRLLGHLGAQTWGGDGRVVLLGLSPSNQLSPVAPDIAWSAARMHMPLLSLPGRLKIAVDQFCSADYELLRWAHPQADIYSVDRGGRLELCDGLVTDSPAAFQAFFRACAASSGTAGAGERAARPALCLQPGNEFLWLWSTMPPAFFRSHGLAIFNR